MDFSSAALAWLERIGHILGANAAGVSVAYISYQGLDTLLETIVDQIKDKFSGLPADTLSLLGIAKVDVAITVIASAYAMRLTLLGYGKGRKILEKVYVQDDAGTP